MTSTIANQDTSHCQDEPWCGLGVFLAAVEFAVWAGLVLLIGLGIAFTTLAVVTRRIQRCSYSSKIAWGYLMSIHCASAIRNSIVERILLSIRMVTENLAWWRRAAQ